MSEPPLRVLSVIPSMARNTGGPAIAQVQATLSMGDRVERLIYCTDAAQPAAGRRFARVTPENLPEGSERIALRVFPTRRPRTFAYSPALFRAIGQATWAADLVTIHSLNLFPQLAAYIHARRTGTPYILTPHGALDPWLRSNSRTRKALNDFAWQGRMFAQASAMHFMTQAEADLASDLVPWVPRYIVPNGVRASAFRALPARQAFRERFLDGYPGQLILFLGRIAKKKGLDILLEAFAGAERTADALLVIVGPDDENLSQTLAIQAANLGVADRVRFLGPLYGEDHLAALASADVWALTSHTENFGNAVLEAMAAGRAVLISDAVNIAPEVEAADAGCITGLDIAEVATNLDLLLADANYRSRLGAGAVAFAEQYDWSRISSQLLSMYRTVVAQAPTRHDLPATWASST